MVMIWLELCMSHSSSCHHHLCHPYLPIKSRKEIFWYWDDPGPTGEMATKMERGIENSYAYSFKLRLCSYIVLCNWSFTTYNLVHTPWMLILCRFSILYIRSVGRCPLIVLILPHLYLSQHLWSIYYLCEVFWQTFSFKCTVHCNIETAAVWWIYFCRARLFVSKCMDLVLKKVFQSYFQLSSRKVSCHFRFLFICLEGKLQL